MMRMTDMDGWVAFVGAGPGDEGLLTLRAVRLLAAAGLIVATPGVADRTRHLFPADAVLAEPAADPVGTARALLATARDGKLAVRLYDGDPLLNGGTGGIQACAKAKGRFEIVPGVPAGTPLAAHPGVPPAGDGTGGFRGGPAPGASRPPPPPGTLTLTRAGR